jgi:hypothetical protein
MLKFKQLLPLTSQAALFLALLTGATWTRQAQANPAPRPLALNREVTSTGDSGAGTLRQALLDSGPGDSISFNTTTFPPGSPATIVLTSALPIIITDNLTIDASNAGVILDGSGTPGGTYGLVINGASGVTIKGLQVVNFPLGGIWIINGASQNTIGGSNTTPGGACSGACNLISGNDQGIAIYDIGTMSNTVRGNYIGTNVNGTAPISNSGIGIEINNSATHNIIGGSRAAGEGNLISGNGGIGIGIYDSTTMSNTIKGNNISTDASGTYAIKNNYQGIFGEGDYTTFGGTTADERNLISGHGQFNGISFYGAYSIIQGNYIGTNLTGTAIITSPNEGIFLSGTSHHNLITGNLIGGNSTNGVGIDGNDNVVSNNKLGTVVSGTFALPNDRGVDLRNGASRNVISKNLISGNLDNGVAVGGSGTMSNTISGNYIGLDINRTAALGNGGPGIYIGNGSSNNYIGGNTPAERNLISSNADQGVSTYDSGTMSNTVSGNYIGTDINGTADLGNVQTGIQIGEGANANVIGGDTPGERNLISGNGSSGVAIYSGGGVTTAYNKVSGNYIGTNTSGTVAIGNSEGVSIGGGAQNNIIGGNVAGKRNLVSGNTDFGIGIFNSGRTTNTVSGNFIGTNAASSSAIPNGEAGIYIGVNAANNMIGGSTAGERNLLSVNSWEGISIFNNALSNTVRGNFIGTDITGTGIISNGLPGVSLSGGARFNTIGGSNATPGGNCTSECNLIGGNDSSGVWLADSGTLSNTISGNYIGTDVNGTATLGNNDGIILIYGTSDNIIGGDTAGERNLISGNEFGVAVAETATRNTFSGNYIGTDASGTVDLGNKAYGLLFHTGAHDNVAKNNVIAYTKFLNTIRPGPGVLVLHSNTLNNTLSQNRVFQNDNKGILLSEGGNNGINRPVLTAVLTNTVFGTALANATIEIFSDSEDEGRTYHGTTTANAKGEFSFTQTAPFTGSKVTVTATDANGNTSEFAINLQGSGFFENNGQQTLGDLNSQASALGDFDIDGDLDAFVANGSPNEVWLNDGSDTFTDSGQQLGDNTSLAVDVGDIDGDGDLDAVVGNAAGEANTVWLNNGNGQFDVLPSLAPDRLGQRPEHCCGVRLPGR